MPEKFYSYHHLYSFTKAVFEKLGCSVEHAELATKVLLSADLRGVDSHGVARLSGYVRLWEAKRANMQPDIKVIHETPSTAVVDGDGGLGLVVAPFAMEIAIDKAMNVGTGWVSVQNSNHFGIAAWHAMMALKHEMIGIAMTNASPLVAPTFSTERLLGTNPICVVIPAGEEPPFVADISWKWRYPRSVVSATQYCRKNVDDGTERISLMTSVVAISAKWQQCPAGF